MTTAATEHNKHHIWNRRLRGSFTLLLVSCIIAVLVYQYGFQLYAVKGISMEPTLKDGQWVLVNKLAARYVGKTQRGEIVVLRKPIGEDSELSFPYIVKRVVAVAGDEVHIRKGILLINGKPAVEPYTDSPILEGRMEPLLVAPEHLFIMGDNRKAYASKDSRSFGSIPADLVQGRVEYIVWPPKHWRSL
ncbi:signal peptidase I [Paenibacillus sp. YYML68]|uniref:signal peptidase I n=1 Tax=Paenibacillus sp. YYML68 TaxID=2909250 RepID=UPI00249011B1|nr:signal peptidase I [Paenibacillus sp. YYML68]